MPSWHSHSLKSPNSLSLIRTRRYAVSRDQHLHRSHVQGSTRFLSSGISTEPTHELGQSRVPGNGISRLGLKRRSRFPMDDKCNPAGCTSLRTGSEPAPGSTLQHVVRSAISPNVTDPTRLFFGFSLRTSKMPADPSGGVIQV